MIYEHCDGYYLSSQRRKHIVDCIKSIQFADEILVIDDGSTDQTVPLATNLGLKLYHIL